MTTRASASRRSAALAHLPCLNSARLALRRIDRPDDPFLDYALWLTARELPSSWLPEVQAGRFDFEGHPGRLVFALQAVGSPDVLKPLLELVRAGRVPADRDEGVQTLIASLGGPRELAMVLELAGSENGLGVRRATLVQALISATEQRKVVPAGDLTRLGRLLGADDDTLRDRAAPRRRTLASRGASAPGSSRLHEPRTRPKRSGPRRSMG